MTRRFGMMPLTTRTQLHVVANNGTQHSQRASDNVYDLDRQATDQLSRYTPMQAKKVGAVIACVQLLSCNLAALPVSVIERRDGERVAKDDHPLHELLSLLPNPDHTAYELLKIAIEHVLFHGNFYAQVIRTGGVVREIIPLEPGEVSVRQLGDRSVQYMIGSRVVLRDQLWHLRGPFGTCVEGESLVATAAKSVGLISKIDDQGQRIIDNNVRETGYFEAPHDLTEESRSAFLASWKKMSSRDRSHGTPLLEGGIKWKSAQITVKDAELLGQRAIGVREIARVLNVPLPLIGEAGEVSHWGSGIEQMNRGFVDYVLRPWITLIEQSMARDLLTREERASGLRIRMTAQALLSGAYSARIDGMVKLAQVGALSPNDIRAKEHLGPKIPGGDKYFRPMNMEDLEHDPSSE